MTGGETHAQSIRKKKATSGVKCRLLGDPKGKPRLTAMLARKYSDASRDFLELLGKIVAGCFQGCVKEEVICSG